MRDPINAGVDQLNDGRHRTYRFDERERLIGDVENGSEELRRQIQRGIDELDQHRYRDYTEGNLDQLIADVAELDERRSPGT